MSLDVRIDSLATPVARLVRDLQLQIAPGVVHTLMGTSGSGKSSVLAAICGTLDEGMAWQGTVHLDGQRIDQLPVQARRVGILFQEDLLFAHMTVRENLLFAVPRMPTGSRAQREGQVVAALADVEMADFLHSDPATLSGGQRTRVSLARALLAQPRALLLDEPFSRLDADLRIRMRQLVFGMVKARDIPALLVTHDMADVPDSQSLTLLQPPHSV
jgi:putative thiamine transport system ATP-binding protein